MDKPRVRIRRDAPDKAECDNWNRLRASCPWRSEKDQHKESLPGRCLAIRQSAWLQECRIDMCAPYYFTLQLKGQ